MSLNLEKESGDFERASQTIASTDPNDERRALQWKYTACEHNIEGANGFYTFSKSSDLSDEEKEELVELVARYAQPDSAPLQPTESELKDFPVAFSYFHLRSGKSVLCRVCAVGRDYGGTRFGNFFAHALILSEGEWNVPISFFDSPSFARGLSLREANLGRKPAPLPTISMKTIERLQEFEYPSDFPLLGDREKERLRALVDSLLKALERGSALVVFLDENELNTAPRLMRDLLGAIPAALASKIAFSTYQYAPTSDPLFQRYERQGGSGPEYGFVTFAPRSEKEYLDLSRFVALDLSGRAALGSAETVFARTISSNFLAFVKKFDAARKSGLETMLLDLSLSGKRDAIDDALAYATDVACLFRALNGEIEQKIKWGRVWTLLAPIGGRIPIPAEETEKIVLRLLKQDYRTAPDAIDHVGEILAFALRFKDDPVDPAIDNMAVDFWLRHIPKAPKHYEIWLRGFYDGCDAIFGATSAFVQYSALKTRTNGDDGSLLALRCLRVLQKERQDAFATLLALTTTVYALIAFPSKFKTELDRDNSLRGYMRSQFPGLLRSVSGRQAFFERVCWDVLAKRARDRQTFNFFFDIFGVSDEVLSEPFMRVFLRRVIPQEALNAWARGVSYVDGEEEDSAASEEQDEQEEQTEFANLVFLDEKKYQEERRAIKASGGVSTPQNSSARNLARKRRASGAEALFLALADAKKYGALKNGVLQETGFFKFIKIQRYLQRVCSNAKSLRKIDETLYPDDARAWKIVKITVLSLTALALLALLGWLVYKYYGDDIVELFDYICDLFKSKGNKR